MKLRNIKEALDLPPNTRILVFTRKFGVAEGYTPKVLAPRGDGCWYPFAWAEYPEDAETTSYAFPYCAVTAEDKQTISQMINKMINKL